MLMPYNFLHNLDTRYTNNIVLLFLNTKFNLKIFLSLAKLWLNALFLRTTEKTKRMHKESSIFGFFQFSQKRCVISKFCNWQNQFLNRALSHDVIIAISSHAENSFFIKCSLNLFLIIYNNRKWKNAF